MNQRVPNKNADLLKKISLIGTEVIRKQNFIVCRASKRCFGLSDLITNSPTSGYVVKQLHEEAIQRLHLSVP